MNFEVVSDVVDYLPTLFFYCLFFSLFLVYLKILIDDFSLEYPETLSYSMNNKYLLTWYLLVFIFITYSSSRSFFNTFFDFIEKLDLSPELFSVISVVRLGFIFLTFAIAITFLAYILYRLFANKAHLNQRFYLVTFFAIMLNSVILLLASKLILM